ncbi:hypothetical protein [Providencia sp.]|uniref:hypothetical protein n=1 Tax=Providencia sp. TaxID=589 RepID=UPI003F9CB6CF
MNSLNESKSIAVKRKLPSFKGLIYRILVINFFMLFMGNKDQNMIGLPTKASMMKAIKQ